MIKVNNEREFVFNPKKKGKNAKNYISTKKLRLRLLCINWRLRWSSPGNRCLSFTRIFDTLFCLFHSKDEQQKTIMAFTKVKRIGREQRDAFFVRVVVHIVSSGLHKCVLSLAITTLCAFSFHYYFQFSFCQTISFFDNIQLTSYHVT